MKVLLFLLHVESHGKKRNEKSSNASSGKPTVSYFDYKTGNKVDTDFAKLQHELAPKRHQATSRPGLGKLVSAAINNVKNVAVNAFDNTVGYGIAQYQNYQTRRELKKSPKTDKYMTVHIPGLFQNIGSQWRFAKLERQKGRLPYHVHPHNELHKAEREAAARAQLDDLKKLTGANPYKIVSGHSDGAALAIGLAQDKKTVEEHKIAYVQARAPSAHGTIKLDSLGKRLLIPLAPNDNVHKNIYARKGAVENASKKPYVPVDVVAGEYDALATPRDAVYKNARAHYLVRGKDSTHFGTSGVNSKVNQSFSEHIDDLVKEHQSSKTRESGKPGTMYVAKSYGVEPYQAANDESTTHKYKKAAHH